MTYLAYFAALALPGTIQRTDSTHEAVQAALSTAANLCERLSIDPSELVIVHTRPSNPPIPPERQEV